jgi:outer membrane beta-barrel protein
LKESGFCSNIIAQIWKSLGGCGSEFRNFVNLYDGWALMSKMKPSAHWITLLSVSLAGLFGSPSVWAKEKSNPEQEQKEAAKIGEYTKEGVDVVQGRVFRKALRHEFTVMGGFIPNNQFLMYEVVEARYAFHFREGLGFEGTFTQGFSQEKPILDDLRHIPCPSPTSDIDGDGVFDVTCPVELENPPDPMQQAYFGNLIWSPIYGKVALFSKKVIHFDLYALAGAGMVANSRSNKFAFDVGIGFKFFANQWMSVRAEFKDMIVNEGAPFNHVVNNLFFLLGASFFLPPHGID